MVFSTQPFMFFITFCAEHPFVKTEGCSPRRVAFFSDRDGGFIPAGFMCGHMRRVIYLRKCLLKSTSFTAVYHYFPSCHPQHLHSPRTRRAIATLPTAFCRQGTRGKESHLFRNRSACIQRKDHARSHPSPPKSIKANTAVTIPLVFMPKLGDRRIMINPTGHKRTTNNQITHFLSYHGISNHSYQKIPLNNFNGIL